MEKTQGDFWVDRGGGIHTLMLRGVERAWISAISNDVWFMYVDQQFRGAAAGEAEAKQTVEALRALEGI